MAINSKNFIKKCMLSEVHVSVVTSFLFSLRTQVVVSVSSDQLEEEELESLLAQVQSPLILSLIVGHHEDPKSSKFSKNRQSQNPRPTTLMLYVI